MKKIILTTIIVFCTFGLFIPHGGVLAAEPVTGLAQLSGCSGLDCSACNVVDLANGVIKWLIGILFVVCACLLAYAGVKLVTSGGNSHALDEAKGMFTNILIGFLIILSAWLIIDTIMRALVGTKDNPGQLVATGTASGWLFWSDVQCQEIYVPKDNGQEENDYNPGEDVSVVPSIPGPAGMPSAGTGSNCGLNESNLIAIPGQGSHRATAATVSRFTSMQNVLAGRGITLTVTSSYRSDARQTELWDECPTCQAQGTVARPCSRNGNGSRHSSGVALDLSSSGNRCEIIKACRSAGAGFIMTYTRSGHVHCDWGSSRPENLTISCPR